MQKGSTKSDHLESKVSRNQSESPINQSEPTGAQERTKKKNKLCLRRINRDWVGSMDAD
jgi:hypothetical protein